MKIIPRNSAAAATAAAAAAETNAWWHTAVEHHGASAIWPDVTFIIQVITGSFPRLLQPPAMRCGNDPKHTPGPSHLPAAIGRWGPTGQWALYMWNNSHINVVVVGIESLPLKVLETPGTMTARGSAPMLSKFASVNYSLAADTSRQASQSPAWLHDAT